MARAVFRVIASSKDEKAIAKRHRYLTIVGDLEQSRVLYRADNWGGLDPYPHESR